MNSALPVALPALRAAAAARAVLQNNAAALAALERQSRAAAMDALLTSVAQHAAGACHGGVFFLACALASLRCNQAMALYKKA